MEQTELEDVELLVSLDKHGFGSTIGWSELLKHNRVILLAEAGAGKSREMKEQVKRLVGEGRFAFCVPLESLGSEPLAHLLSAPDERRFDAWKADNEAPGWVFSGCGGRVEANRGQARPGASSLSRRSTVTSAASG